MSEESLGRFVLRDPWLVLGSAVPPGGLLLVSIVRQVYDGGGQAGIVGFTQSFAGNMLCALAVVASVAAAWVVSPRMAKFEGRSRLGLGLGVGLVSVVMALAVFAYVG